VGWVFFIFSVVTGLTGRGWAAAIYPAGGFLHLPAHPKWLHSTDSRAGRARCKADHAGQIGTAAERWRAWSVSDKARPSGHASALKIIRKKA